MGAAGATGRAGAGVWGGSLFPLGHVRLGGSGYLRKQIHAPLWGAAPLHGARESKDRDSGPEQEAFPLVPKPTGPASGRG